MKNGPASAFAVVICLLLSTGAGAAELLATYTLDGTAADALGNYGDATLGSAPFENGGVYLNGIYGEGGGFVSTPRIEGLTDGPFSVTVEFMIQEIPPATRPVIVGSSAWRWMGAIVDWDGHVQIIYNSTTGFLGSAAVSLDQWHTLVLIYDGATGNVYLDGVLVASQEFTLEGGGDPTLLTLNGANGTAFKGHLKNLNVYQGVLTGIPVGEASVSELKSRYGD
jgi:hypothetical protein